MRSFMWCRGCEMELVWDGGVGWGCRVGGVEVLIWGCTIVYGVMIAAVSQPHNIGLYSPYTVQ